jgi:hypothetical protein
MFPRRTSAYPGSTAVCVPHSSCRRTACETVVVTTNYLVASLLFTHSRKQRRDRTNTSCATTGLVHHRAVRRQCATSSSRVQACDACRRRRYRCGRRPLDHLRKLSSAADLRRLSTTLPQPPPRNVSETQNTPGSDRIGRDSHHAALVSPCAAYGSLPR